MKIKKNTIILFLVIIAAIIAVILTPSNIEKSSIKTLDDLDGKTISVQTSTLYEDYVLERCPNAKISFYTDTFNQLLDLTEGRVDAVAQDRLTCTADKLQHPEVNIIDEPFASLDNGMVFSPNQKGEKLYAQMETYIEECRKNGTIDKLEDYWIYNYNEDNRSDLSGMTGENGTITVAVEAAYEGVSNLVEGDLHGYDIDFINGFCRKYGYKPEYYAMEFDSIAPAVLGGKCDIGTGIVLSEEREEDAILSSPYVTFDICALVMGEDAENTSVFNSIAKSFEKTFIREDRWKMFVQGILTTLEITVASIVIGTILGFGAYLLCKDGDVICEKIISAISWLMHGLPSIVILMIIYYVIFGTKTISALLAAIIGFSLVFACYVFEMIGMGVKAVGNAQVEAARSQGFSSTGTFFRIILPQATWHFLPTFKQKVISLLDDTSIVGYIAILDLTKMSDMIRSRTFEAFFPLIATAIIYLLLIVLLTKIIDLIEPKIDITKRKIPDDIKNAVKSKNIK